MPLVGGLTEFILVAIIVPFSKVGAMTIAYVVEGVHLEV